MIKFSKNLELLVFFAKFKGNGNLEFQILYKFGYWVMRPAENDF